MSQTQTIMTADPTGRELVKFARETAVQLVRNQLTRGQIRNIFTEVRKVEALWESNPGDHTKALRRLVMLKPKLDYQTARNSQMGRLKEVLSEAIDYVTQVESSDEQTERFKRFVNLFEAILAYHRSEGGRTN